jgi:hypothetical protein
MDRNKLNGQFEVLNPWAEVDPIALRGISPRPVDLAGKTVGVFCYHYKPSSRPILTAVEEKLREKLPSLKFSWFLFDRHFDVTETEYKAEFEEWAKGIDAAVTAVGD